MNAWAFLNNYWGHMPRLAPKVYTYDSLQNEQCKGQMVAKEKRLYLYLLFDIQSSS